MSWKPEVLVEGKWSPNGLAFDTEEECDRYGRELLSRWFVPTDSRSVESTEPVNYRYTPAGIERIEEPMIVFEVEGVDGRGAILYSDGCYVVSELEPEEEAV
jgi:hypothetical protein